MYNFIDGPTIRRDSSFKYKDMYKRNPAVPKEVVPMSIADMEFFTAPEITEGLKKYLENVPLGYTDVTDAYYDAVIDWMHRRHDYKIKKEWITLSDGVVTAIGDLILCTTMPGDGVIVFSPVYAPFKKAVELKARKLIDIPLLLENMEYSIDFAALEMAAKEPSTKLIIFCNPHNPIGKVWSEDDLRKVYEICYANGVFIIDDEIHHDIIMPGYLHTVMTKVLDGAGLNIAVCTAPSKSFNIAGLQTSNIIIENAEIREAFRKSRLTNFRSVTNAIGIEACRLAYTQAEGWLDECIQIISENAAYAAGFIAKNIPEIKAFPLEGTYLMWFDFRAFGMNNKELEDFMVNKAFIFADEGYIFGDCGSGFERLNLACPKRVVIDTMERLLCARDKYINKL